MDMSILLALQGFRNGGGSILADFLSKMTFLGELSTTFVILAVIYWCISKDFGTYMMMGWCGNRLVNGFMKVTVCAYRPWIRDPRIVPYGNSMTTATGYSFPSGHTMNASSLFGSVAVRNDMPGTLRILLGIVIALVGFSRNYLGVHTPQDVLIGSAAGLLVMLLAYRLMRWIADHPDKDIWVACIGIGIAILIAVYAALKPYPVDLDANGMVLVDGAKMANDTFKGVGWCCAFLSGWILERRFVGFTTEVPAMTRITRLASGLLSYYAVSLILVPLIKSWIPGPAGTLTSCFLQMFYITFIFPWFLKMLEKPEEEAAGSPLKI